ncbi:MAG: biotin-dependent carboxyltransferase family protein [Devosia sp.]|nr:biotin-dependent carboxyltransferase family protein [Devosia sp.]
MSAIIAVLRAGPLTTIQDEGRFGMLRHGVSASGPMDLAAFHHAGCGGRGGIEITAAGLEFRVASGDCRIGFAGGEFKITIEGKPAQWPGSAELTAGTVVSITPGPSGNYGYVRFDADMAIEPVMGSIATNSRARIGGIAGRPLQVGDVVELTGQSTALPGLPPPAPVDGPLRIVWGLHADLFAPEIREKFVASPFVVSSRLDRMGVRLDDSQALFAHSTALSLVSDAIVPGDIQILGDGSPIVLMRDHQPTGGYPRIATLITADLGRFAQMRPGTVIAFRPVTVEHAQQLLRSRQS